MKKFKVWATTRVHVVRIVEAESADAALEALDGSVEVETTDSGSYRVKACDESNLLDLEIDDEYELCDPDDAIDVTGAKA